MNANTLEVLKVAVAAIATIVALLDASVKLVIFFKNTHADNKFKQLFVWALAVLFTLILPEAGVVSFSISKFSYYLSQTQNDIKTFVSQLVIVITFIGALYPLAWGMYYYPHVRDYMNNRYNKIQ